VLKMLGEIGSKIASAIRQRAKDKDDPFRLMASATASTELRSARQGDAATCYEVLEELGIKDRCSTSPWRWRRSRWRTSISSSASLYPNVDFYSGIILKRWVPTSMFTVLFAVARTVGWIAQWTEMIGDPHQKIGRPPQLFTGHTARPSWR